VFGILDADIRMMGIAALRLFCVSALFGGYSSLTSCYCLATGASSRAALINLLRGILVPLPVCLMFSTMAPDHFWWTFIVSEIICVLIWRTALAGGYGAVSSEDAGDSRRVFSRTITADIGDIDELMTGAGRFCDVWQADEDRKYHVIMAVEEIAAVIISHAFRKEAGEYINISIVAPGDGGFQIHVRYNADFFNPFAMATSRIRPEDEEGLDGLGVFMIKSFSKKFFYRSYWGFNTLVIHV
jgi:anti-sigma regulatory factor (Ser/Thr protein kinase)